MDLEIRQAECFLAAADQKSIVRAAATLRLSPPAVSETISSLERQLGALLFHRLPHGLILTSAGETLVAPARQVLRDLTTARSLVSHSSGTRRGELVAAMSPGHQRSSIASLIGRLRRDTPGFSVQLTEIANPEQLLVAVQEGRFELGFTILPDDIHVRSSEIEALTVHRLRADELQVVLPPGFDDLPAALPLEHLPSVPVIGTRDAGPYIEAHLRALTRTHPLAVMTSHTQSVLPLVHAGVGMALVFEAEAREAADFGCRAVALEPAVLVEQALVHRPGILAPAAQALLELALRHLPVRPPVTVEGGAR